MTLTATGALSMQDVATEIGASLPLSLNSALVIGLANKSALPVSFNDLYGKSGNANCTKSSTPGTNGGAHFVVQQTFMGGHLAEVYTSGGSNSKVKIQFFNGSSSAPPTTYTGNILVQNNRTSAQAVCAKNTSFTGLTSSWWTSTSGNGFPATLIVGGTVDTFTIVPTLLSVSP